MDRKGVKRRTGLSASCALSSAPGSPSSSPHQPRGRWSALHLPAYREQSCAPRVHEAAHQLAGRASATRAAVRDGATERCARCRRQDRAAVSRLPWAAFAWNFQRAFGQARQLALPRSAVVAMGVLVAKDGDA